MKPPRRASFGSAQGLILRLVCGTGARINFNRVFFGEFLGETESVAQFVA